MNFSSVDWSANLGLIVLSYEVFQIGVDNIPPVTLATLILNVYVYLSPVKHVTKVCVSVQTAAWRQEWRRMILGPFHHRCDWHLSLNMVSLLRAKPLEHSLGGIWFACLLFIFSLLTGLVYLLLRAALQVLTEDSSHGLQCIVGFDAVLIGLHVVNIHYHPNALTQLMGFPVATRVTCWMELLLVYALEPGMSVVPPLSGLLVGLLYTKGPLKKAMETCAGVMRGRGTCRRSVYLYESGFSGWRSPDSSEDSHHPPRRSQTEAPSTYSSETRFPSRPRHCNSSQHAPSRGKHRTGRLSAQAARSLSVQLHDLHPRTIRQQTKGAPYKYIFTCPYCPRVFTLRIARNRHLLTHEDQAHHGQCFKPHRQVNQGLDRELLSKDPAVLSQSSDVNPFKKLWKVIKRTVNDYMSSNKAEPVQEEVRRRRLLRFQHMKSDPAAACSTDG